MFLHGGAFETGTVGDLPYGTCTEYAKRGIVFVSIGYRLNVFALHGGENYGLMDMIAAVDWVRENSAVIHYCGRNKPWRPGYIGMLDVFWNETAAKISGIR